MERIERYRGSLLGLAVCDMIGARLEFKPPGSFKPITCLEDLENLEDQGAFNLPLGAWTDDTSLALCLAASLIQCERFDPVDQLKKYVQWYRKGYLSSTGRCFDIGNTTKVALEHFEKVQEPYCGPTDPRTAGNGSLMRLVPVPLFYANNPQLAVEKSGESSRTTHGALECVDACRYFGELIAEAINEWPKEAILFTESRPDAEIWNGKPLCPKIATIEAGSFARKDPPKIRGSGYVVECLEAALWAFDRSTSFEEGALMAINLGDDADTTGAVYGQLAGAFYGERGIPKEWRAILFHRELIENYAEKLFALAERNK